MVSDEDLKKLGLVRAHPPTIKNEDITVCPLGPPMTAEERWAQNKKYSQKAVYEGDENAKR